MPDELRHWIAQAKEHWRLYRPSLYREALAAGKLDELLKEAARRTQVEMGSLLNSGMTYQDAWEMVREEYLFLPETHPAQPPARPPRRPARSVR